MNRLETDVLVVGAGPAGLASAIELGLRGVRVLVAERNARGGLAPRAKTTNVRTRTHLRRWGIADRLAQESPFGIDYPNNMIFVTRMSGPRLAGFEDAFNASPVRNPLYPEHGQWIPQYKLEKVMLGRVREIEAIDLRFDTTFLDAAQDDDGVTAILKDANDEEFEVRASYLIGADGARSVVRDLIGAKMTGHYGLSHHYNIIFRAPGLAQAHAHGPAAIYWQYGKDGFSAIGPMDVDDVWFFMPGGARPGQTLSNEAAAALIGHSTGIDLPYEILSADFWTASELLVDRYADRRILLAGDACHLHPPYGGYGMNMGVGDGVDLGWKIAATVQGWGGPGLVDSYEAERRPVHEAVIGEAIANHAIVMAASPPELEYETPEGEAVRKALGAEIQATKGREFHTLGTVLGLGYENSPIVCGEDGLPPPHDNAVYIPTARPGYLAPHAWLPDGGSLYDLFGPGFTLVVAESADEAQIGAAEEEARALGVPLAVIRPEGVPIRALYEADLTLVRPDQYVAWRGSRWSSVFHIATAQPRVHATA